MIKYSALILSLLGVMACGAKQTPVETPPPPPAAVALATTVSPLPVAPPVAPVDPLLVSGSNWSFFVPNDSWKKVNSSDPGSTIVRNFSKKETVLILQEKFDGPPEIFPLALIEGAKQNGATVNSVQSEVINGNTFTVLDTTKNGHNVWFWLTVKAGVSTGLMCGGPVADDTIKADCSGIAATFKLQ
jgi:hypothetical protein